MWVATIPVFFAVNFGESKDFALASVAVIIGLGALTNGAVLYLLTEKLMRPLIARALSARVPERTFGPGVRGRLVFAWVLGTGIPVLGIGLVAVVVITDSGVENTYAGAAILYMAAVALAVGLTTTLFAAKAIADPIVSVRGALERVQEGDLDHELAVEDGTEVGLLQAGFNRMSEGLREREKIRDLFGRQVGRDVAEAALEQEVAMGGEEREIAAFFVDLVGSTKMAIESEPTTVVERLNEFFAVVIEVAERHGGFVNKFEGDAALCVFGAPVRRDDPAADALAAARELCRAPSRAGARPRVRHRRLRRPRRRRQRRRRGALRVHGDRRPGQRGRASQRPGEGARRAGPGLRRRAAGDAQRRGEVLGDRRLGDAARPA